MYLSDLQSKMVRRHLPTPPAYPGKRGRPIQDTRLVLEGILWVLGSGARWKTCPILPIHRIKPVIGISKNWVACGAFQKIMRLLVRDAEAVGWINAFESFIDATFIPAKKGGACTGWTRIGKGNKVMAVADSHGRPIALYVDTAGKGETTLTPQTVKGILTREPPRHLIGDKAYDSRGLHVRLKRHGIHLIAPHQGLHFQSLFMRPLLTIRWKSGLRTGARNNTNSTVRASRKR